MKNLIYIFLIIFYFSSCQYQGVDVSEYQGNIDWATLSQHINFAILRAGSNFGVHDQQFENNYVGAKNYGVQVGAYWFSYAHNEEEAAREAKACIDSIQGKQFEYPIFYDIEEQEIFDTGLTSQILDTFCSILEKAGYYCGVYSSVYYLNNVFDQEILKKYTVWVAAWDTDEPSIAHSLWQTGIGSYPGVVGDVDADISNTDFGPVMKENHLNGF
jgi:GH25 family lysozyme M1 (1,4-beta-N-acetylmuramidase)